MERLTKKQKILIGISIALVLTIILLSIVLIQYRKSKNYGVEEASTNVVEVAEEDKDDDSLIVKMDSENDVLESEDDTSWDEEGEEDTKVDTTKKENSAQNNGSKYYIKINYGANCITVYEKDSEGNYTIPVKSLVCSTGKATPTSGVYKMSSKYRWHQLNGGVYGQYCTRITGHILFHSVPYSNNTPDSLKYGAYDKLGTKASAGCIRLTTADAMWIYNNVASGSFVEFYSSSDPGPLGKPAAQKISSNETCRNWDPTDPTPGNPWHTYVEPEKPVEPEPIQQEPQPQPQPQVQPSQEPVQQEIVKPQEPEKPVEEQKPNENNGNEQNSENNNKDNNGEGDEGQNPNTGENNNPNPNDQENNGGSPINSNEGNETNNPKP